MKKFPDNSEWSHSIMPKSAPKGTNGGSEQQLPQPGSGQKGKIKP
jgi:hypothetical protein